MTNSWQIKHDAFEGLWSNTMELKEQLQYLILHFDEILTITKDKEL